MPGKKSETQVFNRKKNKQIKFLNAENYFTFPHFQIIKLKSWVKKQIQLVTG